jgi:hypothetical protein
MRIEKLSKCIVFLPFDLVAARSFLFLKGVEIVIPIPKSTTEKNI